MPSQSLDLTLRPPPPLDRRTARLLVGAAALVMLLAALRFWAVGAWLVAPFLLVDAALLAWAFRASRRASRAYERLRLCGEQLLLERTDEKGRTRQWQLPRAWTRVELEQHAPQNRLWLRHRSRRILVGRHLNRRERSEVYEVMARALGGR
jgi:uncharacterized membrane protein